MVPRCRPGGSVHLWRCSSGLLWWPLSSLGFLWWQVARPHQLAGGAGGLLGGSPHALYGAILSRLPHSPAWWGRQGWGPHGRHHSTGARDLKERSPTYDAILASASENFVVIAVEVNLRNILFTILKCATQRILHMCDHHLYQVPEHSHHSKGRPPPL